MTSNWKLVLLNTWTGEIKELPPKKPKIKIGILEKKPTKNKKKEINKCQYQQELLSE